MLLIETRNLSEGEIELCKQVSTDALFEKFKDILFCDLEQLRELSDEEDDRDSNMLSKGARQYISRILDITNEDRASRVFKLMKSNCEDKD